MALDATGFGGIWDVAACNDASRCGTAVSACLHHESGDDQEEEEVEEGHRAHVDERVIEVVPERAKEQGHLRQRVHAKVGIDAVHVARTHHRRRAYVTVCSGM